MVKKESVTVVSPVYNDERSVSTALPELVRVLKASGKAWDIELIDDASDDASGGWIRSYCNNNPRVSAEYHRKNKGISLTYRELYAKAGGGIVVLFSLDGQWVPGDVIRLVDHLIHTNSDIVVGVRKNKQYTPFRAAISFLYNICTRIFFGVHTYDAGSIKAFRRDILNIPLVSHGVFDEAERLIRASRIGKKITYIPVRHTKIFRKRRGIGWYHILQAVIDMVRVYFI